MNLSQCNNIADLRILARKKLPEPVFHYTDGGADDELTLDRTTRAFNDYELMPTQLSDVSNVKTASTLFGQPVSHPLMLSPTGGSKLFHKDGELGVARVAAKHGLLYSLSTLGTTTIEDVAFETHGPKLYQLYVFKDRRLTEEFIERCRESGYTALALTVDTPVAGNRERDFIYGFSAPPRSRLRQVGSFLRHPMWLKRALVDKELEMVNITRSKTFGQSIDTDVREFIATDLERSLTWKDVEWIAERWGGPLVVKGVQSVEDCRRSAESGATAVMLSNHGGRQLESAPAPMDCVAAVADALHDRLEIICDGGIRRGNHIVKALAAGASACSIGRAYLYPLAAGGQAGVERGLALLRDEFERTLALVGCDSSSKLDSSYVRKRG